MSRSIGETVRSLIGRPGEPIPSPDHLEAVRGGQEFVIGDVVIIGSRRSCTRFLLSFRCEQVWEGGDDQRRVVECEMGRFLLSSPNALSIASGLLWKLVEAI